MGFFNREKRAEIVVEPLKAKGIILDLDLDLDLIFDKSIEDYSSIHAKELNLLQRGIRSKQEFEKDVEKYFNSKRVKDVEAKALTERFMKFIDGYHILEELINDESISDIKILAPDNIRVKRYGDRETSHVKFKDDAEVKRFINLVAVKNKINLSHLNAVQCFTDKDSNEKFRLRFNITTEYINSINHPYMHVRKIPKKKYTKEDLINIGLITEEQFQYIKEKLINGDVIIFTGKGASGKTTLMNLMLDEIPHNKSGLIIQENEELFSDTHPDLMFQHVVTNKGEGKIQYLLKDLSINGLLIDLDYFGIGEIKGGEAMYFFIAANTGHKAITSTHGNSATEAMDKLIDYMTWESRYSTSELKKMFRYMDTTICYLKDFKLAEISNINGYDEKTEEFDYDIIFRGENRLDSKYSKGNIDVSCGLA